MGKFSITFLLLIAVVFVAVEASEECGKNEQFNQCGTACPPTCADGDEPKICTLQCVIGCQCKPGYLLNDKHECVSPSEC